MSSAYENHASLTVYRDQPTGACIALAVHRAASGVITPVPWQRLQGVDLGEAVDAALRASRSTRAFAMLVTDDATGLNEDPASVLSRCLARADHDRLSVGPEMRGASKTVPAHFVAAE